ERAIVNLESARLAAPDNWETVRWLGLARAHLALVYQLTGRHAKSARTLEEALATLEPLERKFPKGRRIRPDRAECFVNLSVARIDLGLYPEAEAGLRQAERRLVELNQEDETTVDVRYWLASAKQGLGRVALERGQISAARRLLREAIAPIEQ